MSKTVKVDKRFLIFNPKVFIERELYKSKNNYKIARSSFVFLNIISMLATFLVATLTVVTFSKIIWTSIPDWFFISTTSITAITTFVLSLINFFYVKEKMDLYKKRTIFIYSEIIKYESKSGIYEKSMNRDFDLFQRVTSHIGMKLAKDYENEKS